MEGGSLLQEALNGDSSQYAYSQQNTLVVDIFLLFRQTNNDVVESSTNPDFLLTLARVGVSLNQYLQTNSSNYPWWSGGPIFGVHCSPLQQEEHHGGPKKCTRKRMQIPHLRAHCRYGVAVADEWKFISLIQQYMQQQQQQQQQDNFRLAATCWDIEDGDILMIQSAYELPAWVHAQSDEAAYCRNRCWILQGRGITLIAPDDNDDESDESLSLERALRILQQEENDPRLVSPAGMQASIDEAIQMHTSFSVTINKDKDKNKSTTTTTTTPPERHCAAVAVPRSVAYLLSKRPDLVAAICSAFWEVTMMPSTTKRVNDSKSNTQLLWEDWVWTTHEFGKIQYAVLRNLESASSSCNNKSSTSSIPTKYRSPEVLRLQQQASFEATPHLHAGVHIGVRLLEGLDYLLEQRQEQSNSGNELHGMSAIEYRVVECWQRIVREANSGLDPDNDGSWLLQAWQQGPNESMYDLEYLLLCPVYQEEVENSLTTLSHPGVSLVSQIKNVLREASTSSLDTDCAFQGVPRPQDVDSEDWMIMPSNDELLQKLKQNSTTRTQDANGGEDSVLDNMLGGVKSFLKGSSGIEGIAHEETESTNHSSKKRPVINPTVFLNLLHATLKAESPDDITLTASAAVKSTSEATGNDDIGNDPFFSAEDYNLLDPHDSSSDDGDDGDQPNYALEELMYAMDQELQASASQSRSMDGPTGDEGQKRQLDTHVLSNFVQSIEAGAAGPGPVRNLLGEQMSQKRA